MCGWDLIDRQANTLAFTLSHTLAELKLHCLNNQKAWPLIPWEACMPILIGRYFYFANRASYSDLSR